jgi:hypothetical protein
VLGAALFVTVADLAIVNVALPTIGRDLHMAKSNLQWVRGGPSARAARPNSAWFGGQDGLRPSKPGNRGM